MENISKDVDVTMRQITKDDLKEVHRIMEWGISYQDIVDFYNVRPNDFRGAFLTEKPDQIVSMIKSSNWGDQYTHIGWFTTDKPYRGKGVGFRLLRADKLYLSDTFSICYADPGLDRIYQRFGFQTFRTSHRYLGTAKIPKTILKLPEELTIETVNENNFELIKSYDQQFHSIDRSNLLRMALIKPPFRRSKIAIRDGKCIGYGCIRYSDGSWNTICPLIADYPSVADVLLRNMINDFQLQDQALDIYVPEENLNQAVPLLSKYGIDKQQMLLQMMTSDIEKGKAICHEVPWKNMYGVMFNFGTLY